MLLGFFPIALNSQETILIIENKVANINTPCSGISGIWAAALIFFLLSWIENKKLSFQWFLCVGIFLFTIILGNIIRITILVLLYTVFEVHSLADAIHQPLGIILFFLPILLLYYLFRHTSIIPQKEKTVQRANYRQSFRPIPILISVIIFAFTLDSLPFISR